MMDVFRLREKLTWRTRMGLLAGLAALYAASFLLLRGIVGELAAGLAVFLFLGAGILFGPRGPPLAWAGWLVFRTAIELIQGDAQVAQLGFTAALGLAIALGFQWFLRLRDRLAASQERTSESEERFRTLASLSLEGIVVTRDGVVLDVNEALVRMSGRSRAEIIGQRGLDLVASFRPASAPGLPPTDPDVPREASATLNDGRLLDLEIVSKPTTYLGQPANVTILRDVTARKRSEEMLRRSERLASLGTLVAGVAHEINNPLMYIRGNIELIQRTANEARKNPTLTSMDPILRNASVALAGLDRLAVLSKSLRQVARPKSGAKSFEDVNAIVRSVTDLVEVRPRQGVKIECDLRAKSAVPSNGDDLRQVLLNLILNSIDATALSGSRIVVATRDMPDGVIVEVRDDGPGIPPEVQPHLFSPFFTTKAQGTGLGLSISHTIIQEHGGDLTFATAPGSTIFQVRLPVTRARPSMGVPA